MYSEVPTGTTNASPVPNLLLTLLYILLLRFPSFSSHNCFTGVSWTTYFLEYYARVLQFAGHGPNVLTVTWYIAACGYGYITDVREVPTLKKRNNRLQCEVQ